MSLFNGELANLIAQTLGDSVREPELMDLGDPLTGQVDIQLAEAEHPGLVWVHARRGNNLVISNNAAADDEDKQGRSRALIYPNKIPDDMRVYGTPVYVAERNGILTVMDLGGLAAVEYLYGLKNHPQRSIDVSQLDYGLIRPTAPPSGRVVISPFRPTLDGLAYDVPGLQSSNLIDAYEGILNAGQARAVKIEINPATRAISYEAGSAFTDTTHALAFAAYYPKTVAVNRFLVGWVKITEGMTAVGVNDIYAAQELYSKTTTDGVTAINSILTVAGEVVTSNGVVVWS